MKVRSMLFFKDLKEEKLKDPQFKALYDRECHICRTTMTVVDSCLKMGPGLEDLLARLDISKSAFEALREGDCCDPVMVARLCDQLNMDGNGLLATCPRAGVKGKLQDNKKEGNR